MGNGAVANRWTVRSLFSATTLICLAASAIPAVGQSASLRVSGGYHWTVLASSKDLDEAIGIARLFGESARAVLSDNGWYATVLLPAQGSLEAIGRANSWPGIPHDAFLSNGRSFTAVAWEPVAARLVRDTLDTGKAARVAGFNMVAEIRRAKLETGWRSEIEGTVDGKAAFSFARSFPDASDYETSVYLADLDPRNPDQDIIFEVNSGGAHCCQQEMAVTRNRQGDWVLVDLGEYDGGGFDFEDVDQDGSVEIVHGDNAFLYNFASYAESFQPLVIQKLSGGALVDVTGEAIYRHRVRQDLAGMEFLAKQDPSLWQSNGFLAAWVANKVRLGEGADAWSRMLGLYSASSDFGIVRCPNDMPADSCGADEQVRLSFPDGLMEVLEEAGYIRASHPDVSPPAGLQQTSVPGPATPPVAPASTPSKSEEGAQSPSSTFSGTGFYVEAHTLLTNAHVVDGCDVVDVASHGIKGDGHVIATDRANDLALVKTEGSARELAHLRHGARLGEDISAFGFPLSGFLASTGNFTRGNITAEAGLRDDSRFFQISSPVQPGNSGGPLLDRYGNVVGIVVAKLNALTVAAVTEDIAQNVNFAIKASVAEGFLQANNVTFVSGDVGQALNPEDLAARAQRFAVEILCAPRG